MSVRRPAGNAGPPTVPSARKFTIDELARAAETTARNVRSHQDHGLIDPPKRRGRVGIYTQTYLGRPRFINHPLGRDYTFSDIQELLEVIVKDHDLRSVLGLESTIAGPWPDEPPKRCSLLALVKLFGHTMSCQTLTRAISLGLPKPDDLGYLVCNPKMLLAGTQMAEAGFPLVGALGITERARSHTQAAANNLVSMVVRELNKYGSNLPPVEDVPRLVDVIWRIRPLALAAAEAELMRILETAANKYLDDRVMQVIEHMHEPPDSVPRSDKGQCLQRVHAWDAPDLFLV